MSWTTRRVIAALQPLGVHPDAIDAVLRLEQANGTLPEDTFGLDDVARLIISLLAEGNAAEIDAAAFTVVDVFSPDEVLNDFARKIFDEGAAGTDLVGSIYEILELGLNGKPLVMADSWPIMLAAERVGVTLAPDGGCGWVSFSMWNGHAGAHCAIPATGFFGEPRLSAFITERSVLAEALRDVGQRLATKTVMTTEGAAHLPTLH